MTRRLASPPLLASTLLKLAYRGERAEVLLGDLEERFQDRALRWNSPSRARRWYWGQALGSMAAELYRRLRMLAYRGTGTTAAGTRDGRVFGKPTRAGAGEAMMKIVRDMRLALRSLLRRPGFAVTVVVTLALGIGATTAILSVANAVLLDPLPYPDAERLVSVWQTVERQGQPQNFLSSFVNVQDWKAAATTVDDMAGVRYGTVVVRADEQAIRAQAAFVDPAYFPVFAVRPLRGRVFGPGDDQSPGAHRAVIISHGLWQRAYGGDSGILGRTIELDGTGYEVVGILPADFHDPFDYPGQALDVWLPIMQMGMIDEYPREIFEERRFGRLVVFGSLARGASLGQAREEFAGIAEGLAAAYPDANRDRGIAVDPVSFSLNQSLQSPIEILMVGAALLFVLACVNVTNLVMVRGASRRVETAVRKALGAGRLDLVRQIGAEALLLGLLGGGSGLAVAALGLPALLGLNPNLLPLVQRPQLDGTIVAAAISLGLLATLVVGIVPALRAFYSPPAPGLDAGGRGGVTSGGRVIRYLVVFEVASAMVLLVGSALLVRSFEALRNSDPGFDPDGIVALQLDLPQGEFPDQQAISRFYEETLAAARALPGVRWAGFWGPGRPLLTTRVQSSVPEGTVLDSISEAELGRLHVVDPGELKQLGIDLVAGREFTAQDQPGSPPVAIVSKAFAERLWPGANPVGKRFGRFVPAGQDPTSVPLYEVVGVAANARLGGRVTPSTIVAEGADLYLANGQFPQLNAALLVKADGDLTALPDQVRNAVREIDAGVPLYNVWPLSEDLAREEEPARFAAALMAVFGGLALSLAGLGVYGVLSYSVALRSREVGLRTALGASARDNVFIFVRDGLRLAAVGVLLGLGAAVLLVRFVSSVLFDIAPSDPLSWIVASLALLATAVVACSVPACRAAATDPVEALR